MSLSLRARSSLGLLLLAVASLSGCGRLGVVGAAMWPELGGADALSASYTRDARFDGKIRAFVQAS
jgi:hypothetical protein